MVDMKSVASKVQGVGTRVKGIIRPLGIALPVASPNVNALFTGGPRAMLDYNVTAIKGWRPPDWNTVTGYIDGPGGAAVMTGIAAGLANWAIKELGFSDEAGPLVMLIGCVKAWADGSAIGYGVKELIYPTASGVESPLGGVSFGGMFASQPAKGSQGELVVKSDKAKVRSMMQ